MNAHNNAYTIVSVVFFFTYTIFQAPATILIRFFGPRIFLSAIVLFWGATMIVSSKRPALGLPLTPLIGIWFCTELAGHVWPSRHSRCAGGWILSWMCLSSQHMVSPI